MKPSFKTFALVALCSFATISCNTDNQKQVGNDEANNCFSIIAGRLATEDGSVLFGHNEDDGGVQMLNMNISEKGIWAEFPGTSVADSYMNSYGVCIASDGCQTKEDIMDTTGKGIVYELRQRVWLEATSARHAVHIIAREVETHGYRASGRTYAIADPNEGWLVSVVKGRHWVAQRVPDDMVASIPNYHLIGEVNLDDTANFLGSADLVEYAVKRGWYNPQTDGAFSFRKAYAMPSTLSSEHNVPRHKAVLEALGYEYDVNNVPFAVKPAKKLSVADMRSLLGSHSAPHADGTHPRCVCAHDTDLSAIFQLRNWLPLETGCILWACPGKVCAEVHIPWYLGMTESPKGFQRFSSVNEAIEKHFSDGNEPVNGVSLRERYPDGIYWNYVDRWEKLNSDYSNLIVERSKEVERLQMKVFENQAKFEKKLFKADAGKASKIMNEYTASLVQESIKK